MIALLKGILTYKSPEVLIVDVNGVGYELFVSKMTFSQMPEIGQSVELSIHTHVAEGILALYGFFTPLEKTLFRKLISVSGIGPRLALAILSGYAPHEIIAAILKENLVKLTSISGIGKKTAERLIIELKDKLMELAGFEDTPSPAMASRGKTYDEALSALLNLGYNKTTAERALTQITIRSDASVEHLIRESLTALGK